MLILGINSVESTTSIALSENKQMLSGFFSTCRNKTASMLIPYIDYVLKQSDKNIKNVNAISICSGPGSYTSLRIGYSTVKTLCIVNDIKLIEVSRFRLMVDKLIEYKSLEYNMIETNMSKINIITVLPTTYGKVMTQRFIYNNANLSLEENGTPTIDTIESICEFYNEQNTIVIGEFRKHKKAEDFEIITNLKTYFEYNDNGDSAIKTAKIGYNMLSSGIMSDPAKAEPLYVISPY